MIKKEQIKKALLMLGMKQADIDTAVDSDEEKDIALPDGVTVLDAAGLEQLKENVRRDNKKVVKELLIKDMKTKAGLEYDGKDEDAFIEKFKEAVMKEAGTSVDEKVAAKEKKIEEYKKLLETKDNEINNFKTEASKATKSAKMLSNFPSNRKAEFGNEDYLALLDRSVEFKDEDGKEVIYFNGQALQDDKLNPLPIDKAFSHIFETKKWVSDSTNDDQAKGLGGKDSGKIPGKVSNMKEAAAYIAAQGWNPIGEQAQAYVQEQAKANPNFDFTTN